MRAPDVSMRTRSSRFAIPAALFVIVVLGAALRLYGIANQSLWNDELASWSQSTYADLAEVLDLGVRPDVHPPGYQILLHSVMQRFGDSETALRLPSAIAGILSVLAIYALGAYAYTPKEGLLAAALMAASWAPIYYSQEARPYSLLLLLSILSSLAWLRMANDVRFQHRLRWSSISLYVLVATLACYIHYFGLFLVLFQGFYSAIAFVRQRTALIRAGIAYVAIVALYMPWLPELFADLARAPIWIPEPTVYSLLGYGSFLFSRSLVLVLLAVEAFALLIWSQIRSVRNPVLKTLSERLLDPTFILLMWLVVPVLAAFFKSLVSTPVFTDRNLIICLPAAYLLLARSAFILPFSNRITPVLLSVGAVLLCLGLAAHVTVRLDYYSSIQKEQFREVVQHVVKNSAEYPNNLVIGCVWRTRFLEYYFEHSGSPRTILGPIRTLEDVDLLQKILREESPDYIWYIAANRRPTEGLLEFLSDELREIDSKAFFGAQVWLYKVTRTEAAPSN